MSFERKRTDRNYEVEKAKRAVLSKPKFKMSLWIDAELYKSVKMHAVERELSITEILEELFRKYLQGDI